VRMVDVGAKEATARMARAAATVRMTAATLRAIRRGGVPKGDVAQVARVAGISAAKETSRLLPLCHPLALTSVRVDVRLKPPGRVEIEARAEARDRTGVEMEALTAASVAALTVYDMCKALDPSMTIEEVRLLEKVGGKSGHYVRGDRP